MHLIHRGIVNKKYQENLLKSFKLAFKKGYGVETDIHSTKDHKFVCYHDFTLNRIFKKKQSIKYLTYQKIKEISHGNKKPIPLLNELLKASKNQHFLFIEIKPNFSPELLRKLVKETSKYSKCVFISFKHQNILNLLKINKKIKVGLSFSPPASVKSIIIKSKIKNINCLILDKFYLTNKKIQTIKIQKYFYTIKKKSEFNKYKMKNNLIFENL